MPWAGALPDLGADFEVIVDLAIEYNPVARFRVVHGLVAGRAEIENRQSRVCDRRNAIGFALCGKDPITVIIRTTVFDTRDHATNPRFDIESGMFCVTADSRDAAHT
jgi:hypothetical protein